MSQPKKSVYVRDEARALWERAEVVSGKSISSLIEDLLRRYLAENDLIQKGIFTFSRIKVRPTIDESNCPLYGARVNAFQGHILLDGEVDRDDPRRTKTWVAATQKGNFVFWDQQEDQVGADGVRNVVTFRVYGSLDEAGRGEMGTQIWSSDIIGRAYEELRKLGIEYTHELDI